MSLGPAGGVLAAELCAPLLLLCWLCCWPDDGRSDTSSTGKPPQKPTVAHESGSRRRSTDVFGRRFGSSAASLHLPSTSGKQQLAAHRSHEEIPGRRPSQPEPQEESRYHSAPSVIDEVLRRRAWHHSARDLHIPLRPAGERQSDSPTPACKKHHTNIKSSRNRAKEATRDDVKDTDATETEASFYIGEARSDASIIRGDDREARSNDGSSAKDAKQSLNESIKLKAAPQASEAEPDRSGAAHHGAGPSAPRASPEPYPPASVEAVDYASGACYLAEEEALGALSALGALGAAAARAGALRGRVRALAAEGAQAGWVERERHASDGDILAPALRPESGAFSESDLDLDLDLELQLAGEEERPPAYHELADGSPRRPRAAPRETAI